MRHFKQALEMKHIEKALLKFSKQPDQAAVVLLLSSLSGLCTLERQWEFPVG